MMPGPCLLPAGDGRRVPPGPGSLSAEAEPAAQTGSGRLPGNWLAVPAFAPVLLPAGNWLAVPADSARLTAAYELAVQMSRSAGRQRPAKDAPDSLPPGRPWTDFGLRRSGDAQASRSAPAPVFPEDAESSPAGSVRLFPEDARSLPFGPARLLPGDARSLPADPGNDFPASAGLELWRHHARPDLCFLPARILALHFA